MNQQARRAVALTIAGVVLMSSGCGGGGDADAEEGDAGADAAAEVAEFREAADAICTEAAREDQSVISALDADPSDTQEQLTLGYARNDVEQDALTALEGLEPPAELAQPYADYLEARARVLELLRDRVDMIGRGEDVTAITGEVFDAAEERREVGASVGFEACANRLDEADQRAVEEAVEALEVSTDPSLCTEAITERAARNFFGGVEQCRQRQADLTEAEMVQAVELEDPTGVTGVWASVRGTVEGGPQDGTYFSWSLVHEDGAYKVDNVFELADELRAGE